MSVRSFILVLVIAFCIVALSYFLTMREFSLWHPMKIAFLAASLCTAVITILLMITDKPKTQVIVISSLLLLAYLCINANVMHSQSITTRWQRQTLRETRAQIDRRTAVSTVNEPLLITLREYLNQRPPAVKPLAEVFKGLFPSTDKYIPQYSKADDFNFLSPGKITADTVELVFFSKISAGRNPEFINISNDTGRVQIRGILTKEGITYVDEN